jgi:ubiquinone/menaquinone biosynthesis C-methylase UbiE
MPRNVNTAKVQEYWEKHPAGYDDIKYLAEDPLAFLEERDRQTRLLSPNVAEKYRMHLAKGATVLDLGCGQGFNAQELVNHGAQLIAIDLTRKGIELAVQRFRLRGLESDFVLADSQHLPFKDGTFGFVHSSGVLHHIPNIESAVDELHRVLRPGGKTSIMVYNKSSWRYWYRMQVKLRMAMTLLYILPEELRAALINHIPSLRAYVPTRWPSQADVVNAGTDFGGVENPLSRVFTRKSASRLFHRFKIEGFATSGSPYKPFKEKKNPWERFLAAVTSRQQERFGWYLFVYLEKLHCLLYHR